MSIYHFFWFFWFSHLSAATSNSFQNITVNSNKNLYPNGAALLRSPCNNFSLPSFDGLSVRVSVIRNIGFGGCLASDPGGPYICIKPSATNFSLVDFCSFLILPSSADLYSKVEQGLASPIQTTSMLLNVTGYNDTNGQITLFESVELFVIWDMTDLSRWMPFFGNYGGAYSNTSCNPNQHVQVIRYHVLDNFHGDNAFYFLNFKCSDGKYYKPNDMSSNYNDDLYVECVQSFGINGFTVFNGAVQSPKALKMFCGSYKRSVTVSQPNAINETYFCKPGSIVTGFQYFSGTIVDGFGPICTPANMRISLKSISLDLDTLEIALNSANINITSDVGDVRYSRINVSILNLEPSEYLVSFKGEKSQEVRYHDITLDSIIVRLKTIPSQPIQLRATVNSGVGSIEFADFQLNSTFRNVLTSALADSESGFQMIAIVSGLLAVFIFSSIFGLFLYFRRKSKNAEQANSQMEKNHSSIPIKRTEVPNQTAPTNAFMPKLSDRTFDPNSSPRIPSSLGSDSKSLTLGSSIDSKALYIPGNLMYDLQKDIQLIGDKALAEGGTATIFKGKFVNSKLKADHGNIDLAVKIAKEIEDSESRQSFLYEIALLSSLPKSPNLVKICGFSETPLSIAMKFYAYSLHDIYMNLGDDSRYASKIIHDITSGMRLLHKSGIIHLDLKPQNIMIDVYPDGRFDCVICDFGFSNIVGTERTIVAGLYLPKTNGISVRYASPELFLKIETNKRLNSEADKSIDVYAFAIIVWEIIAKMKPWSNLSTLEIAKNVIEGKRPSFDSDETVAARFSKAPELKQLIEECWDQTYTLRPTFDAIYEKYIKPLLDDAASSSLSNGQSTTMDFSSTIEEMFKCSPNK